MWVRGEWSRGHRHLGRFAAEYSAWLSCGSGHPFHSWRTGRASRYVLGRWERGSWCDRYGCQTAADYRSIADERWSGRRIPVEIRRRTFVKIEVNWICNTLPNNYCLNPLPPKVSVTIILSVTTSFALIYPPSSVFSFSLPLSPKAASYQLRISHWTTILWRSAGHHITLLHSLCSLFLSVSG